MKQILILIAGIVFLVVCLLIVFKKDVENE